MKNKYTYYFAIIIEKGEDGYMSYAPGVGGVYEEGATKEEAITKALPAALTKIPINVTVTSGTPAPKGLDLWFLVY